MLKPLALLLVLWCLLRAGLAVLAMQGDPSPAARERALAHFTAEDVARGREYVRSRAPAGLAAAYWQMALLVLGVITGFWAALHQRAQAAAPGFWLGSVLFLLAFQLLMAAAELPFSWYLGQVVERRMGFSTMTAGQWAVLHGKSLLVGMAIQTAATMLMLGVVRALPRAWPAALPVAATAFAAAVTVLYPLLVTPLFHEQKPLPDGPHQDRILEVASRAGVPLGGVFVIDASRYSRHTNAYFTGLFGRKRVVLYDTLVASHGPEETTLVFAHEVGHWRRDHVLKGLLLGLLGGIAGALLARAVFPALQAVPLLRLQPLWSAANVPFLTAAATALGLLLAPVEAGISRHFERQADRDSLELTGLSRIFVDAEVRLARDNRSDLLAHPLRVLWVASHPPALDRIAMAEGWAAAPPPPGGN